MFEVSSPKKKFNANALTFDGRYRYIVRTSQNNGIKGYIDKDEKYLNEAGTISFGQDTATIFYQDLPYFTGDKIKVMTYLHGELNSNIGCYLLCTMRKAFAEFKWGVNSFNEGILKEIEVNVPIRRNKIDEDHIESYIKILQHEQVEFLSSLLVKMNLDCCELSDAEKDSIIKIKEGSVRWKRVPMKSVFIPLKAPYLRKNTRRQDHVSKTKTAEFSLPVVCAKRGDNGIMYYGRKQDFKSYSNVLSIIYNGAIAAGLVYAHEDEVGIFTDSYLVRFVDESISFDSNLFLKTVIEKKIYPIYSRDMKAVWKDRVENEDVFLPVDTEGNIDATFMETLIRAEKKLAIRGVIDYRNNLFH